MDGLKKTIGFTVVYRQLPEDARGAVVYLYWGLKLQSALMGEVLIVGEADESCGRIGQLAVG